MYYKEKLLMFMNLKNELVHEKTEKFIFKPYDLKIVEDWDEEKCSRIFIYMSDKIKECMAVDLFPHVCPFCVEYNDPDILVINKCCNCPYGMSHDICTEDDSEFKKYFNGTKIANQKYQDILNKIDREEKMTSKNRVMHLNHIIREGDCENGINVGTRVGNLNCYPCKYYNNMGANSITCTYKGDKRDMKLKRILLKKPGNGEYKITLAKLIEKDACSESLKWVAKTFPDLNMSILGFYDSLKNHHKRDDDAEWLMDNFKGQSSTFKEGEDIILADDLPDNCFVYVNRIGEEKKLGRIVRYDNREKNYIITIEGDSVADDNCTLRENYKYFNNYYLIENSEQLKYVIDNYLKWF